MPVEEVYLYPSLPNGGLLPRTRIVGIRAEGQGDQARQIEDDIGVIDAFIGEGIMARGIKQGLLDVRVRDLRDFASDRHRSTDDEAARGLNEEALRRDLGL